MAKIILILTGMFPYNSAGSTLNKNLALGLMHNNSEVEINLMRGNSKENYQIFDKRVNVINGIKFRYASFKMRPISLVLKFIEALIHPYCEIIYLMGLKRKNEIDSIIINTGYLYSYLPIIIFAKLTKITIIKYSVDWFDKSSIVTKKIYILKWYLFQAQIKIFDKLLDGVIPISNFLYKHYLSIGFDKNQLLLIPNFAILKDNNTTEVIIKELFTFGFCGAAPLLNGVDDLLRAFSLILKKQDNVRLIVVGDVASGKSQLPILKEIATKLNISEKALFVGRVPSREVNKYLDKMDVLILPRKKTKFADAGFPTKLGEYFNTGKPVILTKVGDFPYYFSNKEEVVFAEPDDYESLSESMLFLLENQNVGYNIGKRGLAWAKDNLDYLGNGKKVVEFINNL